MAFFILVQFWPCYSQSEKNIVKSNYTLFSIIDDDTLVEIEHRKKRIRLNRKPVDSTGLSFSNLFGSRLIAVDNRLFGHQYLERNFTNGKPENSLYEIYKSGVTKLVWSANKIMVYETPSNIFYIREIQLKPDDDRLTHFFERNFYRLDFSNFANAKFFDLDEFMNLPFDDGNDLIGIYQVSKNLIIATVAYCLGGCSNFKYYRVDIDSGEITRLNLNLREPDNEFYSVTFHDHDATGFLVEVDNYSGQPSNRGFFLWDKDMKEVGRALRHNESIVGYNYENEEPVSKNIKSRLDNDVEVIVKTRFSIELQRSLYQIYSNEPVKVEDIGHCTQHELDLIRNMIFAKHNYKFSNEFYQAYFNCFDFYRTAEKRANRIEDVSKLITDIDKSNLRMVETFTRRK
jgi:hypothetical protein